MCEIDWSVIAEFSKAMLTPMIAVVTAYIAWQQWKINTELSPIKRPMTYSVASVL